jgi:hypothetical protein
MKWFLFNRFKKYNINFPQKNMMYCILLFLSDRCLMDNYMYANFLISSEIQSFLVFLSIKVQHDFSEVKICVRTRFTFDSRFNGRPSFFASKAFLCSFCTFKPLVLAAITLNVVLAQSDLEFFVWSTSSLMSFITALPSCVLVLSSGLATKLNFSRVN